MFDEKAFLHPDERLDDLQIKNYKIIQHPKNSVLAWMQFYYPPLPICAKVIMF